MSSAGEDTTTMRRRPGAHDQNPGQEQASCAACGSADIATLKPALRHVYSVNGREQVWPYRLARCRRCGLGFVDPSPTLALVNTFYPSAYGNYQHADEGDGPITPLKRTVATLRMRMLRRRDPAAVVQALAGLLIETVSGKCVPAPLGAPLQFPAHARMFDLGYGSGAWLELMAQLGYDELYGYDIDANPSNVARLSSRGIKVSGGDFLENDYPEGYFDCIRLSHVFEHLIEPAKVLEKCRRMLRPGGMIVMAHPCLQSWTAELGLDYSPALMLPQHLFHHTPKSTALMLKAAGFEHIHVKPMSVARQFGAMYNNSRRARGKKMLSPRVFDALAPAYRLFCIVTRRGDFMSAWATARVERSPA